MTERQARILTTLIRHYVRTAEPVGSEALVERYDLAYSPATVRAELAALEEDGFLTQPHTSAGRVPTDRGYRYFVDSGMREHRFNEQELLRLRQEVARLTVRSRRLARGAAKLLAELSQNLAVTGVADTEEFHEAGLPELLREPEFAESGRILDVSHLLDALEERFEELTREPLRHPRVYIGSENPYANARHVSMLLTTCELPDGERGLLVLIGPRRMRYDRNIPLLEEMARVLESTEGRPS